MSRYPSESQRRFHMYQESPSKASVKISFTVDIETNQLSYSLIVYLNTDDKKLENLTFSSKDKTHWKHYKCGWPSSTVTIYPNTIHTFLDDLKNEIIEQFMKSTDYLDFVLELRNTSKTLFSSCSIDKIRTKKVNDYLDSYFDDLESRILNEGLSAKQPNLWGQ